MTTETTHPSETEADTGPLGPGGDHDRAPASDLDAPSPPITGDTAGDTSGDTAGELAAVTAALVTARRELETLRVTHDELRRAHEDLKASAAFRMASRVWALRNAVRRP